MSSFHKSSMEYRDLEQSKPVPPHYLNNNILLTYLILMIYFIISPFFLALRLCFATKRHSRELFISSLLEFKLCTSLKKEQRSIECIFVVKIRHVLDAMKKIKLKFLFNLSIKHAPTCGSIHFLSFQIDDFLPECKYRSYLNFSNIYAIYMNSYTVRWEYKI